MKILNKIKSLFKKDIESSVDEHIEWMGDHICLKRKQYPELKDDFRTGVLNDQGIKIFKQKQR